MLPIIGSFAENKDIARKVRLEKIEPALQESKKIAIDFKGVESATQSFIHALISSLIRSKGIEVLDNIYFKNCNDTVQK